MENNKFLNGSGGEIWINGEKLAEVKKVECKVSGKFEDVEVAGDFSTYWQYTGYSIEGTVTLHKINSYTLKLLAKAYQKGDIPNCKIVTKLANRVTGAAERTAITGVGFTEFSIAEFEAKAIREEAMPFKASGYEVLDTI